MVVDISNFPSFEDAAVVLRGPATDPLRTYRVIVDGEVGRVDVPLAHAIQGA